MKSDDEGGSKDASQATEATSTSRAMKTAATAEGAAAVSSVASIAAVATGHPRKGHTRQETVPVKAKCKLKRPPKLPEFSPKEAMVAYRLNLKKKLLETTVEDLKVKQDENTNLKQLIEKLQKEQAEIIKTVMSMKEDEKEALSKEPVYTKDHVIHLRKQNWSRQKQQRRTLQKLTESIANADKDISTGKQGLEYWKSYRDKGQLQHKQEISLLQKEKDDMEKYFEQMSAQLEQDRTRYLEESERFTEEIIEQNQFLATENAIGKMDRYERKEVMENYWLQEELKIQQRGTENLLHETEELAQVNVALLNDANHSRLQDLKIPRIVEQFSSAENLCDNSPVETDRIAEDYLREGPMDLQSLKVAGHHLNIEQSKPPTSEEVKAQDYSHDEWPVTQNMLKEFCQNSGRHY